MSERRFDHSVKDERLNIWRQSKLAYNHLVSNRHLIRLLILSFVFTAIGSVLMPWQALLVLRAPQLNPVYFGWITGALFVATLLGSLLVSRSKLITDRELMLTGLLSVLSVVVIGLSFVIGTIPLLGCLFSIRIIRGYYRPVYSVFLNEQIPDNLRATMLSLRSMSDNVATILILILSGWLAEVAPPTTGIGLVGLIVLAYATYRFSKTLRSRNVSVRSSGEL